MIAFLEGKLLKKEDDRIVLLVQQVGYEILLPAIVSASLADKKIGDELALHIYYYQTERQPKPVLIGFNQDLEKVFFQQFLSVEAIGPLKAVKALSIPVNEIASAIESRNVLALKQLQGIGDRTARKIVATLEGKMGQYIEAGQQKGIVEEISPVIEKYSREVVDVLTGQLGYKKTEAQIMVTKILKRKPFIKTAEELFEEVFKNSPTP
jgi:Holliday junction DNA helicase RuvA